MIAHDTEAKVRVGLGVWGNPKWIGKLYPSGTPRNQMLEIYSGIFNAVEGNTTFHALPTLGRLKTWAARTPERFEFFVKFPRSITHDKKLYRTDEDILRFLSLLKGIKSKVGTLMIQLPPSFDPSLLDRILRLKEILPTEFTYAIEFRHPDFFANPNLEIFDLVKTRCFQPGVFG